MSDPEAGEAPMVPRPSRNIGPTMVETMVRANPHLVKVQVGRIRPHLVVHCTTCGRACPSLAEIGRHLADIGPSLAEANTKVVDILRDSACDVGGPVGLRRQRVGFRQT